MNVTVIGAGLAGCETALYLAKRGVSVKLIDIKPKKLTPAHSSKAFGELVCSNSLKSTDISTAGGLLKAELEILGCSLLEIAKGCTVAAGSALAVDRKKFEDSVTNAIKTEKLIEVECREVEDFVGAGSDRPQYTVIATGPLTTGKLADNISKCLGGGLYFFDAAAPIVSYESLDLEKTFIADRYGKRSICHCEKPTATKQSHGAGSIHEIASSAMPPRNDRGMHNVIMSEAKQSYRTTEQGDYINCPLTKDEYYTFVDELITAKTAPLKNFDDQRSKTVENDIKTFAGCQPVEYIAKSGRDSLRHGPMRPVGLRLPDGTRPYAVLQLRRENANGTMYNLVGFQTNLTFGEQKRVFGLIPALKNSEYLRYGVMHRNTYINAPTSINSRFECLNYPNVYVAGQLSGVEGYVESIASGLITAIDIVNKIEGKPPLELPQTTILGSLTNYLTRPNNNFQPMNANFGLLPPIDVKKKDERKRAYGERAIKDLRLKIGN